MEEHIYIISICILGTVIIWYIAAFWIFFKHKTGDLNKQTNARETFEFLKPVHMMRIYTLLPIRTFYVISLNIAIVMIIRQSFREWRNMETKHFQTEIQMNGHHALDLPDILACLNIRYDKSKFSDFNFNERQQTMFEANYIQGRGLNYYSLEGFNDGLKSIFIGNPSIFIPELNELEDLARLDPNYYTTMASNIGFLCNEFIKCYETDCCNSAEYMQTMLGRCTLIQTTIQHSHADVTSRHQTFNVRFDLPANSTPGVTASTPYNHGLVLRFRNPSIKRFDDGFFYVSGRYHTFMKIQAIKHVQLINKPQYPCIEDGNYDIFGCYIKCLDDLAADCHCIPIDNIHYYPQTNQSKICSNYDEIDCVSKTARNLLSKSKLNESAAVLGNCNFKCPPPCNRWIYDKYFTFTKLLLDAKTGDRFGIFDDHTAILTVQYDVMLITSLIEREYYTIANFISNVGGINDAWLGASWLTIIRLLIALGLNVKQLLCCRLSH